MERQNFNGYDIRDGLREMSRISIDKANAFMGKFVFPMTSYIHALELELAKAEARASEAEAKVEELKNKNVPLNKLIDERIEEFITSRVEVNVDAECDPYDGGSISYKATIDIKG